MNQILEISEPGLLIFVPRGYIQDPPPPPAGTALPASATTPGWPALIEGIHSDGIHYWYQLWNDADTSKPARYARLYDPFPPTSPPAKVNRDGTTLYRPKDNQQQTTCQFDPVAYD